MSNERVIDALLPGYAGPYFPISLEILQRRYRTHPQRFCDLLFYDVADRLHDGHVINQPMTSDVTARHDSPWSHAIKFTRHDWRFQVLFPLAIDSKRRDGTYAVRHVAGYAKGDIPMHEVVRAFGEFAEIFTSEYRHLFPKQK